MKTLYKFLKTKKAGKIYTCKNLEYLFFKEKNRRKNKNITFKEWLQDNLDNGVIINYSDKRNELSLEEVVEYACLHDNKFNKLKFIDNDGNKYIILDAVIGLFMIECNDKIFSFDDLESHYKDKKVFSIIS